MNPNEFTEKRVIDLSRQAFERDYVTFSDFLTIGEIDLLKRQEKRLYARYILFGGYSEAERQMAAFLPDAFSVLENEEELRGLFPITLLRFRPVNSRFAENFTHRDALGAVMNLGFGREKCGDLLLKEGEVYIFAENGISDFLRENLHQIRKTSVYGENTKDFEMARPKLLSRAGTVPSNRLDAILSEILGVSRSKAQGFIKSGVIYINSMQCYDLTRRLLPQDIISARGFGKYLFEGEEGETKKGRVRIRFSRYE